MKNSPKSGFFKVFDKMPDIKKQYQELAKKHKLPDFDRLNLEFEISNIEETSFLLRSILSRIGEKIEFFLGNLGEMLHPDSSNIYSIQEYRFFDESERKNLFDIYRMLMSWSRNSIEVSLMCDEKEEAKRLAGYITAQRQPHGTVGVTLLRKATWLLLCCGLILCGA